ncbi:MAG: creatininase family protein [Aestuariivita sp.]|nr:creatininase family protein [Aestuariivita sp.]
MQSRLNWSEYRHGEFLKLDPQKTIAILPTAAIEQHGPHLPVGTDMFIAEGMLDELRRQCPDDIDILILPTQSVGKSNEHLQASGTLTLTAKTTLATWTEIGLSVARAGLQKIVIVNSHGGNLPLIDILARELRVQAQLYAVKCQWGSFGCPEGLFSEKERTFGIHGGDVETSLMLAFQPHTVDMTQAHEFNSSAEAGGIAPIGPISYGWISSDLNSSGVVGEAHLANVEKGHMTCRYQVAGFIELLRQVRDTKPTWQ